MGGSRSRGGHSSAWLRCFGATFLQLVDEREETLIWTEEFCCEIHKGVGWDWELAFVKLPLGWECRQNKDELQQHFRMWSLPPKGFLYILKHTAAPVKLFLLATQIRQETSPLKHELKRKLTITYIYQLRKSWSQHLKKNNPPQISIAISFTSILLLWEHCFVLLLYQVLSLLSAVCFQGVYFSLYEVEISNKDQDKMDQLLENLRKRDLVSIVKRLGRKAYIYQLTSSLAVTVSDEIILLNCLCIASTITAKESYWKAEAKSHTAGMIITKQKTWAVMCLPLSPMTEKTVPVQLQ